LPSSSLSDSKLLMVNSQKDTMQIQEESASLRRRHKRVATRVTTLLHCHGRFQTVHVLDFSLGGLQLEGCFGIGPGDDLILELLSGHRVGGKCAWSIGGRVGVRFPEPLSEDHPALAVLRQGARRVSDKGPADAIHYERSGRSSSGARSL
jgi:PilZ domain